MVESLEKASMMGLTTKPNSMSWGRIIQARILCFFAIDVAIESCCFCSNFRHQLLGDVGLKVLRIS